MTVSGGSKAFYRVVGLERGELSHMARGMATFHESKAIIVVDCSNLLFGVGMKMKNAAEYLFEFAKSGVTILPVCDNDVRPSVKQETIKRRANREKARTKEYLLRREAKETERKRKETASHRPAIADFADGLEKELDLLGAHIPNEAGGSVLEVVTAQCQADTYMAGQIRNKDAVMVLSTDTDIPLITGDSCISIKVGFSKKNFELVSTSKATLEKAMTFLGADTKAELMAAVHPIFERVNDDRLRSLMMLISGCDVFPSGLKNVGITKLSKTIDEFKKTAHDPVDETALFEHLIEMMKKEFKPRLVEEIKEVYADEADAFADVEAEEVVQAHLDALVYEPTNKAGEEKTYLGGEPPKELFRYCEEFAASDTKVSRGPTILKCKGVGGKEHNFLDACGHSTCAKCKHDVCTYCQATIGMDTNTYCLLCSATESLVPEVGTEAAESVDARRTRLINVYKFAGADNLDSDEVEDVLEMMDFLRDYRAQGNTVPFPLYKTEEMESATSSKWEEIAEIDFSNGGAFLSGSSKSTLSFD